MTADLSGIRSLLAGIGTEEELKWDGANQARRALWTQDGTPVLQCSPLMYPEPQWAAFIAAAPSTVARLLGIVEDILAISDIGMNSEHGDPAFIQGWECALEEVKARIESAGEES